MSKIRPITGSVANLDLLETMAKQTVADAQSQQEYFSTAISAAKKKVRLSIEQQKAAKTILRRRNQFPSEVGKVVVAQKRDAAFKEAQARSELAQFKEKYNLCREVEFQSASFLKLIQLWNHDNP